jgi:hypothetical protein
VRGFGHAIAGGIGSVLDCWSGGRTFPGGRGDVLRGGILWCAVAGGARGLGCGMRARVVGFPGVGIGGEGFEEGLLGDSRRGVGEGGDGLVGGGPGLGDVGGEGVEVGGRGGSPIAGAIGGLLVIGPDRLRGRLHFGF